MVAQALEVCGEALTLFASYGDALGGDRAAFLRCALLPHASPGGSEVGAAVAQRELADLLRPPARCGTPGWRTARRPSGWS